MTGSSSPEPLDEVRAGTPPEPADDAVQGLAALAARILDQLSLSAWLPAGFLVAALAFLSSFARPANSSFFLAMEGIADQWLIVLVTGIPGLILVTTVTQAFSFEAIRRLEGYGGWSRSTQWAVRWSTNRQARRRKRVQDQLADRVRGAWALEARLHLLDAYGPEVTALVEASVLNTEPPGDAAPADVQKAARIRWQNFCDPYTALQIGALTRRLAEFPAEWRVLPTRLGNVLRATEDTLEGGEGDVPTFVHRHRSRVPHRVRTQHDQFRTRLDMYATLALVSVVLIGMTLLVFWLEGTVVARYADVLALVALFGLLSRVSYLAAVSSARSYGRILRLMDLSAARTSGR